MHAPTLLTPTLFATLSASLLASLAGCGPTKPNLEAASAPAVERGVTSTPSSSAMSGVAPEVELLEIERDLALWRARLMEAFEDAARLHAMVNSRGAPPLGAGDLSRPTLRRRFGVAHAEASALQAKISSAEARRRELGAGMRASE